MRSVTRRAFVAAVLSCITAGSLAGCAESGLAGKTLYSVSAWDGVGGNAGEVDTITFDDGDWYHYAPANASYEDTGKWKDEDGDIVLTSSTWSGVTTLVREDDGSYSISGDNDALGIRFFLSEDDARTYTKKFVGAAPERVAQTLESSDFTETSSPWVSATTKEAVSFHDGEAVFTKGVYSRDNELGTYLFKQGPSEDEWTASDHSGGYEVTVDKMLRDGISNDIAAYTGTLTVGGDAIDYKLTIDGEGKVQLVLERLTFSAAD